MFDQFDKGSSPPIDITKGLSDLHQAYVPDFGYTEMMTFGDHDDQAKAGVSWKTVFDNIARFPKSQKLLNYM